MPRVEGMKRGSREEVVGFRELYDQKEGGRYPFSAQDDFSSFSSFFLSAFCFICSQGFLFQRASEQGHGVFGWGIIRCVNIAIFLFSRWPKMSWRGGISRWWARNGMEVGRI
jgi:hypothetical protein